MSETNAWAERRAAIAEEYGKYVATSPIDIDGVRAFNRGDAVPKGHVDGYSRPEVDDQGQPTGKTEKIAPVVHQDYVAKVNTKAATAAQAPVESA